MVYYASSSDHALHALDLQTGRERWNFITDGPVRLAPEFHGGNLLFGSDAGRATSPSPGDRRAMAYKYCHPLSLKSEKRKKLAFQQRTLQLKTMHDTLNSSATRPRRDSFPSINK